MSDLFSQTQKLFCQVQGHEKHNIQMLCFSSNCKLPRSICAKCIRQHQDHIKECFDTDEVSSLMENGIKSFKSQVNTVQSEIQGIFREFQTVIIEKLKEIEKIIEANTKKLSNDSQIVELGYTYLSNENLTVNAMDQFVKSLIPLVEQNEQSQIQIKNTKSDLESFRDQLQSLCKIKLITIFDNLDRIRQLAANDQIIISRLNVKEPKEQWLHSRNTYHASQFTVVADIPVYLTGLLQPKLKIEDQDLTMIYRIHQGRDLTKSIFEYKQVIEHKKMEIANGDCYRINFRAVKLDINGEYTISSQGVCDKQYTWGYTELSQQNNYIKFQSQKIEYAKPNQIEKVISEATEGMFPSLIIQERYKE